MLAGDGRRFARGNRKAWINLARIEQHHARGNKAGNDEPERCGSVPYPRFAFGHAATPKQAFKALKMPRKLPGSRTGISIVAWVCRGLCRGRRLPEQTSPSKADQGPPTRASIN
jgi:hypothetical protein